MSMFHGWIYGWDRMIFYYSSCISVIMSMVLGALCFKYFIKLSKSSHMTKQYKIKKRGRIYKWAFWFHIIIATLSLVLFCYLGILREVPNVEQIAYKDAITKLEQVQLQYNFLEEQMDGIVLEQSIAAGTIVRKGTRIRLKVEEKD